jgi:hypothetical protein
MVHPQVVDGGDGLQIWRIAANILNKKSWTADKGWSSGLGLITPHSKKLACYEMSQRMSDLDGSFGYWLRIGTSGGLL